MQSWCLTGTVTVGEDKTDLEMVAMAEKQCECT